MSLFPASADDELWSELPPSGVYEKAIRVDCHPSSSTMEVFLTWDGSEPDPKHGEKWKGPIQVDRTRVLRAGAFEAGKRVGVAVVRTWIFPESTLVQSGQGFPDTWGVREGKPVPSHYRLSPEILHSANRSENWVAALKALPSVSLVLPQSAWFDSESGIYAHPMETGNAWERDGVLEWIPTNGLSSVSVASGIRIQGGWNRRPEECPKHSFRVRFKKHSKESDAKMPFFGSAADRFGEIILRGGCNNSWLHWSADERKRGDYLRDQWMRDCFRDMGHLSARGTFVHVYLNGLYWGIYNLVERPAASFLSIHLGGAEKQYEVRNADHVLSGSSNSWHQLMGLVNDGLTSDLSYREVQERIDLPLFIDYMALNLYAANADYDRGSNWYAARSTRGAGKFQFFVWDGERCLEFSDDNQLAYDDDQSPPRIFQKLRENAEFRIAFGDRVYQWVKAGGVFAPERAAERFAKLAAQMAPAIGLESARWGTYRLEVHPYKLGPYERYTVEGHWKPEIHRLLNDYFPKRTDQFVAQLQKAGLYSKVEPPEVVRENDGNWRLLNPSKEDVVYWTANGEDPRSVGGRLAPSARPWPNSLRLPIQEAPEIQIRRTRKGLDGESAFEFSPLVTKTLNREEAR